jgi:hypothetical protein
LSQKNYLHESDCKISGFSKLRNKDCPLLRLFDVELYSTGKKARNYKMKLQKNISMPDLQ